MFRGNLSRKLIQTNGEISVRLLICAGGTGGGVYPALAVHNALKAIRSDVETLWVGGEGGMEARLVERASIPFKTIPAAGVHGVDLKELPGNLKALSRGVFASRDILDEFKPDVLAGFFGVPYGLALNWVARRLGIPYTLVMCGISAVATRRPFGNVETRNTT